MTQPAPQLEPAKRGLFAKFWLLAGGVTLFVAALSAVNTAFDLDLAIGKYGSSAPLPKSWEAVIGLVIAGLLILGLTFFGSAVARTFRNAKGRPLVRVAIVIGALVLLVGLGRGLQVAALLSTYGSMLAYYCTDVGSVEEVKAELADGPDREALDRCLFRAGQWGRTDLLAPVIEAGGDFENRSAPEGERRCVLRGAGVDLAFVKEAIRLGARPESCARSEDLIHYRVIAARKSDDAETAAIVTALAAAGWSVTAHPDHTKQTPLEEATKRELPETARALEKVGARSAAPRGAPNARER